VPLAWEKERMNSSTTTMILPGSRLTMIDLKWLIDSGWQKGGCVGKTSFVRSLNCPWLLVASIDRGVELPRVCHWLGKKKG
jgi:cobyric acid synthase